MIARAPGLLWPRLLVAVLTISAVALAESAQAQRPADAGNALEAHLAVGEFGPAREIALAEADLARRNAMLRDIAVAQAAAGARGGSLATLGDISDDRERLSGVDAIRGGMGGGFGGAALADFDTLIELITSTVSPDTWEDNGGNGAIQEFPSGVLVDSQGVLRRIEASSSERLEMLRRRAAPADGPQNPRRSSELRKVSLTRLEKAVQLRWMEGQDPDETMRHLAGLYRVQYVLVYPETGDIVLAGPAGDWRNSDAGSIVNVDTNEPVLQLDDFIVLLRQVREGGGEFGCAIKPREANLAKAQELQQNSAGKPLRPGQRTGWLEQFRSAVGRQDVEVFGIDPRTRVARIMVEADYRMKLVGIGLEEGTVGLTSYLDMVAEEDGEPPALSVLRWWFTMHYDAVRANAEHTAFEIDGQAVRVLSENELLTERGERIHTGASEEKNQRFADSFTRHFPELARKYPIYAELRNIFDLALVANLIEREGLADSVGWHLTHFADPHRYVVPLDAAPKEVETVMNHRVVRRKIGGQTKQQIIAMVSGGVTANPAKWVGNQGVEEDSFGRVQYQHNNAAPQPRLGGDAWWWD